jgi:hypothetical protein
VSAKAKQTWQQRTLSGAVTGLLLGVLGMIMALVLIALSDRQEIEARLGMGRTAMSAYYVLGGAGLGALTGFLSTWMHGRWGRVGIGIIATAAGTLMLLPSLAGPPSRWGGGELLTVCLVSVVLGPLLARQHAGRDRAQDI